MSKSKSSMTINSLFYSMLVIVCLYMTVSLISTLVKNLLDHYKTTDRNNCCVQFVVKIT